MLFFGPVLPSDPTANFQNFRVGVRWGVHGKNYATCWHQAGRWLQHWMVLSAARGKGKGKYMYLFKAGSCVDEGPERWKETAFLHTYRMT